MSALKRFFAEIRSDNLTGESAKVAYYLYLSLFPLILVIFSLTGLIGGEAAFDWIMARVAGTVPPDTAELLGRFLRQVTSSRQPGIFSVGLLLLLWSASGGFAALADGLNTIYDVEESRGWFKKHAIALGVVVASAILLVGGTVLILAGPAIAEALALGPVWNVLRWPIAFVLLVGLLWLIYYALPNRDQGGAALALTAGAVVGAALWLGVTAGFRYYISNFGSYGETYGFIGAVIVLLLWLYLTALVILFGAEVADVIGDRGRSGEAKTGETGVRRAA